MTITYHMEMEQGSDLWFDARRGRLTAGDTKLIVTPGTMKRANNDKSRAHLWELLAQRISGYTEPTFQGDEMLRGLNDEIEVRAIYSKQYAPVTECGFVTNDTLGFLMGYSPDGLVGNDGMIEVKSRRQKFQIETIVSQRMPDDFLMQVQAGLFVTGRKWCDFISFSAGLPMVTIRVEPDPVVQLAIVEAAKAFESELQTRYAEYAATLVHPSARLVPTERKVEQEMFIGEGE